MWRATPQTKTPAPPPPPPARARAAQRRPARGASPRPQDGARMRDMLCANVAACHHTVPACECLVFISCSTIFLSRPSALLPSRTLHRIPLPTPMPLTPPCNSVPLSSPGPNSPPIARRAHRPPIVIAVTPIRISSCLAASRGSLPDMALPPSLSRPGLVHHYCALATWQASSGRGQLMRRFAATIGP